MGVQIAPCEGAIFWGKAMPADCSLLAAPNVLVDYASCVAAFVHLHPFSGLFSRATWVVKVKPIWILMKQEMMGWQWHQMDHMHPAQTLVLCPRQIITPAPRYLFFYRPDALPDAQPTVSKRERQYGSLLVHAKCSSSDRRCDVSSHPERTPLYKEEDRWKMTVTVVRMCVPQFRGGAAPATARSQRL